MSVDSCCGRLWMVMVMVMVLVMQTDAPLWDSLVFEGIDEVDVEAVTAAFGTVEVVAKGRAAGADVRTAAAFRTGSTTVTSAG
ncbi:hypothetical protein [Streptomyces sp. NPDC014995]|uniref:hypothetical protein n=1 Tax=Streptomyces sp. NPDC014995 TaxID=3364936 RepID=UPI0036FE40F4